MKILVKIARVRYVVIEAIEGNDYAAIVDSFCDDRGYRPRKLIEENLRELGEGEYNRLEGVIPCIAGHHMVNVSFGK